MKNEIKGVSPADIRLTGGFWGNRTRLLSEEIIPYQWDTLNNRTEGVPLSHAVENFKIAAGESRGEPEGTIFQDSDVAKWIEAASYSLMNHPDAELEKTIDELIRLIGKSQHDNGYLNTFFTAKGIEQRWSDLVMGHEMYCAGHLMEAAVAYYQATGKKPFLDIMCRYADLIYREFGPEEDQIHSFDGHPEIELALYRLADASGESRYRDLADYFVNIRGSVKNFYKGIAAKEGMIPKSKWFRSDYYLAHKPVREMTEVTGHAVRAVYLYASMADQYRRTEDPVLLEALNCLWDNLVKKRVYITAGIGSQSHGERFTVDYDLPSDRGYTETCASIGLIFWAWRMSLINPDRQYADMIERALYNGSLSGISLDGKSYFYVNPLEINPETASYRQDLEHVETHRVGWFDCACCPTNIARLIGSVGQYAYSSTQDRIYLHQYLSSETVLKASDVPVTLKQQTEFPWNGSVSITVEPETAADFSIALRIPGWCRSYDLKLNGGAAQFSIENGYLILEREWKKGDLIELTLDMVVELIQADSSVSGCEGRAALVRGPLVYCLEEIDNGSRLNELIIKSQGNFEVLDGSMQPGPSKEIILEGYRESVRSGSLYSTFHKQKREPVSVKAVPYFQWGNRDEHKGLLVWFRVL